MTEKLEVRMARLEKSARRWKVATLGVVVIAGAGVMMGQIRIGGGAGGGISAPAITADKVTIKKLIITDADGNERGSMGIDAINNAELALKDKSGIDILTLRADPDGGATMKVSTTKGKMLLTIGADGKDQPSVVMQDAEGKKVWGAP
jgi:hypothetical protein